MPDGRSKRQHLEQVERSGFSAPELENVEFPTCLTYIIDWYVSLDATRLNSGFGPNPITYNDIINWSALFDIQLTTFEFRLLKAIDNKYLEVASEKA